MMWDYSANAREVEKAILDTSICSFCATPLVRLPDHPPMPPLKCGDKEIKNFSDWVCAVCGWWKVQGENVFLTHWGDAYCTRTAYAAAGSLKHLDLADITLPIQEVRDFLAAKYGRRSEMNPTLFEQTVASVFRDLGYSVVVTGRSGDGGIDMILYRGTRQIGVQVKRYANAIEAEQIRSLTGALVKEGMTRGIFVTTSTFRSGAFSTAETYGRRGYAIELMDSAKFYDALQLTQLARFPTRTDLQTRHRGELTQVAHTEWVESEGPGR